MARLETERLILRPPEFADAPAIAEALGDFEISKNLASAPHPYTQDDARVFIASAADGLDKGESFCFAVRRREDDAMAGCCGLHLKDGVYELGYWIAKPHWRQGYATEAAFRLLTFAFYDLQVDVVTAGWFHDNWRSEHVLAKLGFKPVRVEKQDCRARGHALLCNRTMLTRERFGRKKAA